jgi:transcriptional regulator with XRE-family HTH domain
MSMCKCGGLYERKLLDRYVVPSALLGAEHVTLVNAVSEETCSKCGKSKIYIPDLPGLITAVALTRVKLPFKLNPKEIRFVRKVTELSAKEMADLLKVTPETLSRWENEKMPMAEQAEVFFRLISIALLSDKAEAVDPEMEKVVKMEIKSAFDQEELSKWMHFVRVFRDRKDKEADELWKDNRKVANG